MSSPRSITVQVWGNAADGYTAYLPDADITRTAPTFTEARDAALAAAPPHPTEDTMTPEQADTRWTCICGVDNPPGRTSCSSCQSPQL